MGTLINYVHSGQPDLTNRQMAVLMIVYFLPAPHTVRGLAAQLRVCKPVVTRVLNKLGALGFLRRQKDLSDLRSIFVERTPQGRAFIEDLIKLWDPGYNLEVRAESLRVVSERRDTGR
ncbi:MULTISPECIES: MarR family transcriptional regulator [Sphingosinicellaceae]|uniref:MarR family transcriptional regulator n=1 Tax=Sphingosinicellaceae TaxID=2820280 RepID=UPI001C1DD053|nr:MULTISPECIES: MarR family transcriptional regulator [Polymorphobacter]QYE33632.1 MarR family transcriptional regulator [Polymorphobacter sp. PAMC 29334]UAJ12926.1 MarR family transcriptional regulator [Polymorphobacter megasporae]